jgi:DNA-binding HxlR family transcriptional regulator
MNYYLNKVPIEIRHSIKQLNNDQKWAVYIALTQNDKKTFTELKEEFKANPGEINRILKSLTSGGLIVKRVDRLSEAGDITKIHYNSTSHGEALMNCFCDPLDIHNNITSTTVKAAAIKGYLNAKAPLKLEGKKQLKVMNIALTTTSNPTTGNYREIIASSGV